MPVIEIGESERKAVWEKENELRFRDGEFGKSVGRLDGDVRYLKCASEVLEVLCSSLECFLVIENKCPQTAGPFLFNESSKARPV